jgi:hypothetical protein
LNSTTNSSNVTTLDTSTSHYFQTDEAKGTDRGADDEEEEETGTNYTVGGGTKRGTAHEEEGGDDEDDGGSISTPASIEDKESLAYRQLKSEFDRREKEYKQRITQLQREKLK